MPSVVDDCVLCLKSYAVGAVKTWLQIPATHPGK